MYNACRGKTIIVISDLRARWYKLVKRQAKQSSLHMLSWRSERESSAAARWHYFKNALLTGLAACQSGGRIQLLSQQPCSLAAAYSCYLSSLAVWRQNIAAIWAALLSGCHIQLLSEQPGSLAAAYSCYLIAGSLAVAYRYHLSDTI